jgi:hypothetical protein
MVVPIASLKLFQKHDTNLASLFNTILISTPCNLIISSIYNWTNSSIEVVNFIRKKLADLVNLSTTTYIVSFPVMDLGSLMMKSVVTCSHF